MVVSQIKDVKIIVAYLHIFMFRH